MTLTVKQSLNAPAHVATVYNSTEARRPSAEPKTAAITPQGSGIRSNARVLSALDAEQHKPSFRSNGNGNDAHAERAVAAYQSLQHQQRRNEIQSMLGVDLYA
ncbi:hypothetical protein [Rheinheimera salexigens]|uniref:Uncharacterized protein n=1 Tax=Rheinheimera salexigens TaxID=1628148 RepID=A0A1E7Q5D7_9GAMM|nr:hypothetical protein [Rheinheimera salexigens]OEY69357.1 hypothetical protein BI198_07060 [Rheinheimera salexigens]